MITFNELRIARDGECLIVDVEIKGLEVYKNMYIKSISLDYYQNILDKASSSLPSVDSYKIYNNDFDDQTVQHKRISFPQTALPLTNFGIEDFDKGLFFVTVICDGNLPAEISSFYCGADDTVKIGVVVDWKSFYSVGMQYVARLANKCADPCLTDPAFEDFVMQWNALKLAIDTCNWPMVAELWKRVMRVHRENLPAVSGGCGCGR